MVNLYGNKKQYSLSTAQAAWAQGEDLFTTSGRQFQRPSVERYPAHSWV